jgi:hypothetical protein
MPVIRHQQLSTIPLRHGVKIFSYNVEKNSDRQAQTLKDARANDYDVFMLQEPQSKIKTTTVPGWQLVQPSGTVLASGDFKQCVYVNTRISSTRPRSIALNCCCEGLTRTDHE